MSARNNWLNYIMLLRNIKINCLRKEELLMISSTIKHIPILMGKYLKKSLSMSSRKITKN
jgi:hypothetical protein